MVLAGSEFQQWAIVMIGLILDVGVLWLLLNIFSDDNWDDSKFKIFGIVLAIAIFGGFAAAAAAAYVGVFPALIVYFLMAAACLWLLADLPFPKAAAAGGIYVGYKLVLALIYVFLLTD